MAKLVVPSKEAIAATLLSVFICRCSANLARTWARKASAVVCLRCRRASVFATVKVLDLVSSLEKMKDGPAKALDELIKGMADALERMGGMEAQSKEFLSVNATATTCSGRLSLSTRAWRGRAECGGASGRQMGGTLASQGGGGTNVTVNVQGSVIAENELKEKVISAVQANASGGCRQATRGRGVVPLPRPSLFYRQAAGVVNYRGLQGGGSRHVSVVGLRRCV